MHTLSGRIVIAVVLFVLLVVGLLIARSQAVRSEAVGPRPSDADLSIKEIQLQEQSAEGGRWQLVADHAEIFEQDHRTALRNVRVRVEDRDRIWTITGEEGDLFNDTRNFEIRRNVVVTSDDGLRLETSVLHWRASDRRLWTKAPVRIVEDGAIIHGSGLEVDMSQEAATVTGRVHAAFPGGRSQ
jgi:LPS export ABC transporter protein LptC